jgi:hypothetical protein
MKSSRISNRLAFVHPAVASVWWAVDRLPTVCRIEVLSPTPTQFNLAANGAFDPTGGSVTIVLGNGLVLHNLGIPIRILVETTRRVRIANPGIPPDPRSDLHFKVTNVLPYLSSDCNSRRKQIDPFHLKFPIWAAMKDLVDPPPIDVGTVNHHEVFGYTSMITLGCLDPRAAT